MEIRKERSREWIERRVQYPTGDHRERPMAAHATPQALLMGPVFRSRNGSGTVSGGERCTDGCKECTILYPRYLCPMVQPTIHDQGSKHSQGPRKLRVRLQLRWGHGENLWEKKKRRKVLPGGESNPAFARPCEWQARVLTDILPGMQYWCYQNITRLPALLHGMHRHRTSKSITLWHCQGIASALGDWERILAMLEGTHNGGSISYWLSMYV